MVLPIYLLEIKISISHIGFRSKRISPWRLRNYLLQLSRLNVLLIHSAHTIVWSNWSNWLQHFTKLQLYRNFEIFWNQQPIRFNGVFTVTRQICKKMKELFAEVYRKVTYWEFSSLGSGIIRVIIQTYSYLYCKSVANFARQSLKALIISCHCPRRCPRIVSR